MVESSFNSVYEYVHNRHVSSEVGTISTTSRARSWLETIGMLHQNINFMSYYVCNQDGYYIRLV